MFIFSFDKIECNPNLGDPNTTKIELLSKNLFTLENSFSEGLKYFECLEVRIMFDNGYFSIIFLSSFI